MKTLCVEMNCMYWLANTQQSYGCSKYGVAYACPVNNLKRSVPTEYGLYCDDEAYPSVIASAMALCPDPVVRLQALAMDPIESLESHQAYDRLSGDDRADRIAKALKGITIGEAL